MSRMSGWKKLWHLAPGLAGFGAFIQQVTNNDVQAQQSTTYWSGFSATQKAASIVNWTISRITFGTVPYVVGRGDQAHNKGYLGGVKPDFANAWTAWLNKWTGLGIGALIYKHIPIAPQRSKVGRFGIPLIAAGVVGGILGDYSKGSPSGQAITRGGMNAPQIRSSYGTSGVNA